MNSVGSGDADSAPYRAFMGAFPTGVTVITSLDQRGDPHGITCTSLCSVTLNPPTLLVSIRKTSPTLAAVRGRGSFAVNLLHAHGRAAAELFSTAVPNRFSHLPWRFSPALGLPWLWRDSFALAECVLGDSVLSSDHEVVLGEVVSVEFSPEIPLLYGMRQFCSWPTKDQPVNSTDGPDPDRLPLRKGVP